MERSQAERKDVVPVIVFLALRDKNILVHYLFVLINTVYCLC
jgi:hypothetical protein